MNAFDQDDPDSSQATQMIQDLLEPQTSPSKSGSTHNLRRRPQNQQPTDISADSLPSSRTSHSIPLYHFHGLASTQTQSQHYDEEDEPQEGSQKENIGAVKTSKESPPSRPASPGPSSSRNPPAKPQPVERRAPAAPSTEKGTSKKATNVTFQSPRQRGGAGASTAKLATRSPYKPSPPPVSRYKQPPRPPVRTSSQDSFAYDPVGNEGRFIAAAEQFALPLSELAKGSSPIRDSDTSGGTSLDSMYHRNTRQQGRAPPPSPPRGRVLVEATPSQSTQSESQPQSPPVEPAEPVRKSAFQRLFPNVPETESTFESANLDRGRHAAYGRADPGGPQRSASPVQIHPDLLATQSSIHDDAQTQPSHVLVETQPSTQVDDSRAPEPDIDEGATPFSIAQSVLRSTAPTGASRPRSLIDMVPAQNQWRYRQYGNAQNSTPYAQPAPAPSIPPSELQETQPSFDVPPPRRGFPPPKSLTATTVPSAPSLPSAIPIDAMDVVPDSEPARRGIQASPKKAGPQKPVAAPQKTAQVHPAEGAAGKGKAKVVDEDSEMSAPDEDPKRVADAEEDEEEEDIPLAVVAAAPKKRGRPPAKKNVKAGKGKEVAPPPPSAPAVAPKSKANPSEKLMQKPVLVPAMTGRSWENGVVPSSVPEQDLGRNTRNTRNRPAAVAEPKKKATQKGPQSKQSSRSTSNAPRSAIQEEEEEEDAVIPSEHENEEGTEPADEDYQDADVGPSRKRKRPSLDKVEAPVKGTRGGAKRAKRPAATPGTRAAMKPAPSTGTRSGGSKGSRVFALWIQDGHYYPGTVHSTDNQQRYNIKFDDGTESWVTIDDMRACELLVGDDVLHDDRNRPSEVTNVDGLKDGTVEIFVDDRTEAKQISELSIAHKTIMFSWNDRRMMPETVITTVKPVKKQVSPSPSKMSMVSVPSVRGHRKKVLSRTALIVTLAAGVKEKWEKEKESLMNAVKNSGGFVIDDLDTIIKMDGKHAAQGNRWTIRKADAKWIGSAEISRLFLLADDANQKPKFLIALALGIPCLSTTWLEESVEYGKEREWAGYLLPQGYSTALGARASQQIDFDWGNSIYHVTDIMNNRVACKLFAGKSILCVGQDMVCHPKGKRRAGNDDKSPEASNSVPRIILAMGAEVVEAVTEPRHASQGLSNYDYLVIREPAQYSAQFADCTVVHWAWVKDCLIASRYLPLPTWTEADESQ